jgi:hypothetical protein
VLLTRRRDYRAKATAEACWRFVRPESILTLINRPRLLIRAITGALSSGNGRTAMLHRDAIFEIAHHAEVYARGCGDGV